MALKLRERTAGLDERLAALDHAVSLATGVLPDDVLGAAKTVVERAGARRRLSVDHTVAALAGATGSGKSSLFNAMAGAALSPVGVLRPTTSRAQSCVWGAEGSGALLDWLEIPRRHQSASAASRQTGFDGLILLDLPDHDSIQLDHQLEVDRLVELVDLLVWVLDPQKYADALVHERYLRPLAQHRDVMVVVLNQVDRLDPAAADRCLKDLHRLLEEDGLAGVPVLATSATTGTGLDELRTLLAERVRQRRAWAERLSADITRVGGDLADSGGESRSATPATAHLVAALSEAAGVPVVARAVEKGHRYRCGVATGWPLTRWLRRLRPDPLRRLRLESAGRTSLPAATSVQRSLVDTALRDVGGAAARDLPGPWATAVRRAARSRADALFDELDRAVSATELGATRPPRWWRAVGFLQWLIFAAAIAGAMWLLGLFVLGYLRLPEPGTPTVGALPVPTALLLGGVIAGLLVALLSRIAGAIGGRRRRRKAERRLRVSVERVGQELVMEPVAAELNRHREFAEVVRTLVA